MEGGFAALGKPIVLFETIAAAVCLIGDGLDGCGAAFVMELFCIGSLLFCSVLAVPCVALDATTD